LKSARIITIFKLSPQKETALTDNSKVDRANAQFAKLQRAEDGKKATTEYEAERIATLAKTERLKALRMARDSAGQSAAPNPQDPVATVKKPPRKKRGKAKSLAHWLNDQDGSGRRS